MLPAATPPRSPGAATGGPYRSPGVRGQPEAPERLPGREADERAVLLDHGLGRGAREEVEVERPAEEAVLDQGDGRRVWRLEERV